MGARSLDHLLGLPHCARCGHEVERIEDRHDALVAGRVLTAYCHGDREVSIVRDEDLLAALPGSFRYGLAFTLRAYQGWRVMRGPGSFDVAPDLRDSAFSAPRPFEPRSIDDAFAAWAYAAYGVRRFEPPEGSG